MDEPGLLENCQCIQQLSCEDFHELCTQALELVLLDELVQIGRQQLKHQTQVVLVDEGVTKT